METPAVPMPKDERERRILETLTVIQDNLLLLKRDRTKYIRTEDVMVLYDQLEEQVKQLNEVRKGELNKRENRCRCRMLRWHCENDMLTIITVDKVLESCFQLISLFF